MKLRVYRVRHIYVPASSTVSTINKDDLSTNRNDRNFYFTCSM